MTNAQSDRAGGHRRVCIIGAGGIGSALADACRRNSEADDVWLLSRGAPTQPERNAQGIRECRIDITDAASVAAAAQALGRPLDLVIVATGTLHDDTHRPEKSLRQIDAGAMREVLNVNTIGPAIVARHFLPLLNREGPATFAALSARVGSIADNRLGGWYSYRASKAALNMLIRTFAIELRRTHPAARIVGLHPGTVDTELSAPFQRNVPEGKLFTPAYSAERLLSVLDALVPEDSGSVFDWAGKRIPE